MAKIHEINNLVIDAAKSVFVTHPGVRRDLEKLQFVSWKTIDLYDTWLWTCGFEASISPAEGSTIRWPNGWNGSMTSQHFYGRAIDVMIKILPYENVNKCLRLAATKAKEAGFTGIGVYPDWKPSPGLHLDTRPGKLAQWGAKNSKTGVQYYVGIQEIIGTRLG